jgi:3-isopropylmalate/(R)-2-methylmalate dehydratase small subunit
MTVAPTPNDDSNLMTGRAWKVGDDINTDLIYPGKYLAIFEPAEMAKHAMEGIDPEFPKKVRPNDFVVAGKYFGCGSSREQAATCLKHAGVGAVIAKSFARIFYRNAINLGLPILICKETEEIGAGDILKVNFVAGTIENTTKGKTYTVKPLPEFLMVIIKDGGLIPHLKKKMAAQGVAAGAAAKP